MEQLEEQLDSRRLQLDSRRFMKGDFPFAIHRCSHDALHVPQPHSHDFVELVYVEQGSARHLFEGESYDLRTGDVFIINPGETHSFELPAGGRLGIINCLFQPHLIQEPILRELHVSKTMDYFYIHPFLNPGERFNHLLNLRGEDARRILSLLDVLIDETERRRTGYQTLVRLRMIELLMLLSRGYDESLRMSDHSRDHHRCTAALRICGYLERHYQQKNTLESLSLLFNISARHLNRIFREEIGMSVVEKIHRIRIEKARSLLVETDEKIINIAAMIGYEDPAFFSRLFTREVGCAPGRFRTRALSHSREEECGCKESEPGSYRTGFCLSAARENR